MFPLIQILHFLKRGSDPGKCLFLKGNSFKKPLFYFLDCTFWGQMGLLRIIFDPDLAGVFNLDFPVAPDTSCMLLEIMSLLMSIASR